jgi:hypothetical protein
MANVETSVFLFHLNLFCSCSVLCSVPVLFQPPEQNREQNRYEISGTGTEQEQSRNTGTEQIGTEQTQNWPKWKKKAQNIWKMGVKI